MSLAPNAAAVTILPVIQTDMDFVLAAAIGKKEKENNQQQGETQLAIMD